MKDVNGNVSEVAFDVLGLPVATARDGQGRPTARSRPATRVDG